MALYTVMHLPDVAATRCLSTDDDNRHTGDTATRSSFYFTLPELTN